MGLLELVLLVLFIALVFGAFSSPQHRAPLGGLGGLLLIIFIIILFF